MPNEFENLNSENEELEVEPTENQPEIESIEPEGEEPEEEIDDDFSDREKALYARVKKAEAKRKELQQKIDSLPKPEVKPEKPAPKPKKDDGDWKDKYEELALKQDFPDLNRDEIALARKYAGVEGKGAHEVIKSTYFQAQVSERKEREKQQLGNPSPSYRTGGGGSLNSKFEAAMETPELIREMDDKTYQKFIEYREKKGK